MSGNRDRYEHRRNRDNSQEQARKGERHRESANKSQNNGAIDIIKILKEKLFSYKVKAPNMSDSFDFDENEYFGGPVSHSDGDSEKYDKKSAAKSSKPAKEQREKRYEHREPRRPRNEYNSQDRRRAKSPDDYLSSVKRKAGAGLKKGADLAKKGADLKKGAGKLKNGIDKKIPAAIAGVAVVFIFAGILLAVIPGIGGKASEPNVSPQDIFPTQTYTYNDGLITMGLEDQSAIAQNSEYKIPLKPKEYDPIVYSYPAAGKRVALTFDDGPSKEMTDDYIQVLADNNVKATFFLLAKNVQAFPDEARMLQEAGHDIANHSLNHAQLSGLSGDSLKNDFAESNKIFKEVLGKTPKFMRPPYGSYNDEVLATAREYGQIPIYWSIDTNDWRKYSTETMVETIKSEMSDGAIILMHEGKSNTLEALPTIIQTIRDMGYEIVPLSELLSY